MQPRKLLHSCRGLLIYANTIDKKKHAWLLTCAHFVVRRHICGLERLQESRAVGVAGLPPNLHPHEAEIRIVAWLPDPDEKTDGRRVTNARPALMGGLKEMM